MRYNRAGPLWTGGGVDLKGNSWRGSLRTVLSRSWPFAALAFAALLLAIALLAVVLEGETRRIDAQMEAVQQRHRNSTATLQQIRLQMHRMAVVFRDYLLDPSGATPLREELASLDDELNRLMQELSADPELGHDPSLAALREALRRYLQAADPVFAWTARERAQKAYWFLRREVVPQRDTAVLVTDRLELLIADRLAREKQAAAELRSAFFRRTRRIFSGVLALCMLIALLTVWRLSALERRAALLHRQTAASRAELQRLSQELVHAQERERTELSRELHDEVGQLLTALQLELGNLPALRGDSGPVFEARLRDCRELAERTLRLVREMAMGLRPSILDDFGLGPALEWQAKQFARRSGILPGLQIEGDLDHLPDAQRTCLYRLVQEALTNVLRHAKATAVRITLHGAASQVTLSVQDDGIGFDPARTARRGLGLLGMQERVGELGGRIHIHSESGKGTLVRVEMPLPQEVRA